MPISRTRYVDAARRAQEPAPARPTPSRDRVAPGETTRVPDRGNRAEPARTGTAFQSNADGDSVTLSSRLDQLTDEERTQVEKLKARDAEVRAHEQAHVAAAGGLVRGGINYTYQTGPDGTRYAVGGHVNIDTSPGRTPEETIAKAQRIRAAALAPAEPSGTDRAAAAKASRMEAEARAELRKQNAEQADEAIVADPAIRATTGTGRAGEPRAVGLDILA